MRRSDEADRRDHRQARGEQDAPRTSVFRKRTRRSFVYENQSILELQRELKAGFRTEQRQLLTDRIAKALPAETGAAPATWTVRISEEQELVYGIQTKPNYREDRIMRGGPWFGSNLGQLVMYGKTLAHAFIHERGVDPHRRDVHLSTRPPHWQDPPRESIVAVDPETGLFRGIWEDENGRLRMQYLVSGFVINDTEIPDPLKPGIDAVGILMHTGEDVQCLVVGRASETGPDPNNIRLSRIRAENVANRLRKIAPLATIKTVHHGSFAPLATIPAPLVERPENRNAVIDISMIATRPRKLVGDDSGKSHSWGIHLEVSDKLLQLGKAEVGESNFFKIGLGIPLALQLGYLARYADGASENDPPLDTTPILVVTAGVEVSLGIGGRAGQRLKAAFEFNKLEKFLYAQMQTYDLGDMSRFRTRKEVALANFHMAKVYIRTSLDTAPYAVETLQIDDPMVDDLIDIGGAQLGQISVSSGFAFGNLILPKVIAPT